MNIIIHLSLEYPYQRSYQYYFDLFSVSNAALRGSSEVDAACVQQWINFADNEILPSASTWLFPCMGLMQFNKMVSIFTYVMEAYLNGSNAYGIAVLKVKQNYLLFFCVCFIQSLIIF